MLIENYGWRTAFIALPAIWGFVVIPIILLLFSTPRDRQSVEERKAAPQFREAAKRAIREQVLTRRFIQLAAAGFGIALAIVTLAVSLVPLLSDYGLERGEAAAIAALLGFASIAGRLTIGFLLDRVSGRFVAAFCVCLPILGVSLLLGSSASALMATSAVLIFGLALGAELDILAYLTSRYFRTEDFGLLFGVIGGLVTLAGGLGPMTFNAIYDSTGSHELALWCIIPLCLVSAILVLLLGPYPDEVQQEAGGEAIDLQLPV